MERCLLDTMAVLWMALRPDLLGKGAVRKLADSDLFLAYSVVSLWEIGIKMAGKGYHDFELPDDWDVSLAEQLDAQEIVRLEIEPGHCRMIQDLPFHHRDPFDRMIIVQALQGNFTVIGSDKVFDDYGVGRVW
ncbi:MAG: type II toxin-antitoxin system VapC family toxin [Luteolibacter sp.]|jgi:PIN domain nuclease of toxin-antitoxin system|nr:type II toxin-antitoxin system VapC family toxin [Luteolibacter sp.]